MPRRWTSENLSWWVLVLALLALYATVAVMVARARHESGTDRAVIVFAGLALVIAVAALIPNRKEDRTRQAQLRAEVESTKHLARIAELLEEQQREPAATRVLPETHRRHSKSSIVALILVALVVTRWLRSPPTG